MPAEPISFGELTFDAQRRSLSKNGKSLNVSERASALMAALIEADGRAVSKQDLIAKAWPSMIVEEGNLTVQIAALRKALGSDANGNDWIVTVPRVGYRLLLPQPDLKAGPVVVPSLVVLPFQNLSGDQSEDYFADGVVEDIITALSRFKSFAVVTRNAAFLYKGSSVDLKTVSAELGARYVLEGSVRRAGSQLRITAQLVEAATGAHLWAERFDGTLGEVFDFQDRITESVATLVEPSIQSAEIKRSRRERPGSVAAYDLYLQALPRARAATESGNAEAYALVVKAIALEPNNPAFLSEAVQILGHRLSMGWRSLTGDDKAVQRPLIDRAMASAPNDALTLAHCAGALVHTSHDYDLGMAAARRAMELNPNNLRVVDFAGIVYLHCGDLDEALMCFHRALRLSPADIDARFALTGIAHVRMIHGDYGDALVHAERSLTCNPNFDATYWMLIAANAQLGRMEEARRWLVKYCALSPGVTIARIWAGQPQKDGSRCANVLEGLRLAGLPEA